MLGAVMIKTIAVTLPCQTQRQYPILVGASLYNIAHWLPQHKTFSKLVIITDDTVKKHYGSSLLHCLQQAGHQSILCSFPAGELHKTNQTKQTIEHSMLDQHCDRDILIIALGGGVVGDLAGYIAATYLRGVAYLQIPTTVLAMVDSSVGGKTGLNTPHGKNMLGIIYQPVAVVIDPAVLTTLPAKQQINGLIEAIKIFLTHDAASFHLLAAQLPAILEGEHRLLQAVIARAVSIKAAVVGRDEQEQGERYTLNFGHTIAHALEKISDYRLLHGYAVAYGILVETNMAYLLGELALAPLLSIQNVLRSLAIQGNHLQPYDLSSLLAATKHDKKQQQGQVYYPLLRAIGSVLQRNGNYRHPVADEIIIQAWHKTLKE